MEWHDSQSAPAEARGRSPEETPEQLRKREDRLLESAGAVTALRNQLSLAFGRPYPEPVRPKTHWDYLMEEMQWLHIDFAQVPHISTGCLWGPVSFQLPCKAPHLPHRLPCVTRLKLEPKLHEMSSCVCESSLSACMWGMLGQLSAW